MATVNLYLTFNGNCEEAFSFYSSVFGKSFSYIGKFRDMPSGKDLAGSEAEKIMHVSLPINRETVLMGCDAYEDSEIPAFGNNFSIEIDTESEGEALLLFNAISTGGEVTRPLGKTFWGAFFGKCIDKFGIHWSVNHDY